MNSLRQCAYDFAIANSASDSALAFALFIDQVPPFSRPRAAFVVPTMYAPPTANVVLTLGPSSQLEDPMASISPAMLQEKLVKVIQVLRNPTHATTALQLQRDC